MSKPRRTGPALVRTYIKPHDTRRGRSFQARVIDVRTGADVKQSAPTILQALEQAKLRVTGSRP